MPDTTPPVILEGPIVEFVTHDHALVYWVTNKPTTSTLTYGSGSTKALSGTVNSTELALKHSVVITNLLPATGYTVNCTAQDPAGNQAQAEPRDFETPAPEIIPAPVFTVMPSVSEIVTTSALLSWTTDQATDAYAMVDDGQKIVAVGELRIAPDHAFRLTGLVAGTTYTVTVRARNTSSIETESNPVVFSTAAPDTVAPAFVTPPVVTVATNGASATLAWTSTELALAQVAIGTAPNALTAIAESDALGLNGDLALAPLTRGTTYYYTVTLTDEAGNPFTSEVASFQVSSPQRPGGNGILVLAGALAAMLGLAGGDSGGGGGGPCFIATAAYGTPMSAQIDVLREFRDTWLLSNAPGTALVDLYYQVSPSIAQQVAAHPALAVLIRLLLLPVIVCAKLLMIAPGFMWATIALSIVAIRMRMKKRTSR
ncbi:MAG: fibronectin type III domain-containing protein [FCB group bacterium]|nr:fibronectin type III domain-containing protein [FCB group bacterium]